MNQILLFRAYQLFFLPYSGKFSWGRNFHNFHDQTPACENLFPRKFLPPKISCQVTGSAAQHRVRLPQLVVSKQLTYVVVEASSKLQKFFAQPMMNSPVVTATANRSSELAPFGMTVFCWQRLTRFDKCGNVLLSFWRLNTRDRSLWTATARRSV